MAPLSKQSSAYLRLPLLRLLLVDVLHVEDDVTVLGSTPGLGFGLGRGRPFAFPERAGRKRQSEISALIQ